MLLRSNIKMFFIILFMTISDIRQSKYKIIVTFVYFTQLSSPLGSTLFDNLNIFFAMIRLHRVLFSVSDSWPWLQFLISHFIRTIYDVNQPMEKHFVTCQQSKVLYWGLTPPHKRVIYVKTKASIKSSRTLHTFYVDFKKYIKISSESKQKQNFVVCKPK